MSAKICQSIQDVISRICVRISPIPNEFLTSKCDEGGNESAAYFGVNVQEAYLLFVALKRPNVCSNLDECESDLYFWLGFVPQEEQSKLNAYFLELNNGPFPFRFALGNVSDRPCVSIRYSGRFQNDESNQVKETLENILHIGNIVWNGCVKDNSCVTYGYGICNP